MRAFYANMATQQEPGSTVPRTYRTELKMSRTLVLVVHNPTVVMEELMRGLLMEAGDTGCHAQLCEAAPLDD